MSFQGCISRKKINAHIWLNNAQIPEENCDRDPAIKLYGFYRKLNTGELEFVSFCTKKARDFVSMRKSDFEKLMNEATVPDEEGR